MWINPKNSNHIIDGTDGGIGISYDKGATWEAVYNMDLGQFYHVTYDMETPYNVCGGLQDNYTWCGPTATRSRTGIANDQWFQIHGGDGFEAQIDPTNSRIIYAESQDGNISRIDKVSNERKSIRPLPARGEAPLRWNWNTPILMSPHDPATIYVGANKVFKSTDRGQSWTAISPDLTEATDREGLTLMGRVAKEFTIAKNDGVQSYGNIVQLVESPKTAGVLYAGTDDGKVHMTRDGKTWTDITGKFPGVPKNAYVSRLTASAHDVNVVYATFDNHRADDMGTYVYASVDGGNNFRSIGEGIPKGHAVTSMAEDPKNPSVLYTGLRVRVVRQSRPRRQVDARQVQPADGADPRDHHPPARQRHDRRDPRPQHLDPRRHLAAAAAGGGDEGRRVPVRHARRHAVQPGQRSRLHRRQAVLRQEPDLRSGDQLLPVEAADQRGAADSRWRRHAGARDHRQRSARGARRRHQPRVLGHASSAAGAAGRPAGWWWRRWWWRWLRRRR